MSFSLSTKGKTGNTTVYSRIKMNVPYNSVTLDVSPDEEYADGDAFKVEYELTGRTGEKLKWKETFLLKYDRAGNQRNPRTSDFLVYLAQNGIFNVGDFIGCQEQVVFKRKAGDYRTFPSIQERVFVSAPGRGNNDGDA